MTSKIDSAGIANPLGIGVTNPSYPLHVLSAAGASGTLSLSGATTTGGPSYIIMGNNDSAGTGGPNVIVAANRSLQFGVGTSFTAAGGGTFTKALGVESMGAVTLPLRPVASVSHSAAVAITVDTELTSANFYDTTWVNIGNCWNASTGRFTCPVSGVYRLFFRCTSNGSNCNVRLRKNGVGINEAYGGAGGDLQTVSSEAIVSCVAGDYLNVQVSTLQTIGGSQHKQVTFEFLG